jgi:hypothetical protein
VQGEWLSVLRGHPSLAVLGLYKSAVGDEAIPYLKDIPKLQELDIRNARFTANGIAELKQAKPTIRITGAPTADSGASGTP